MSRLARLANGVSLAARDPGAGLLLARMLGWRAVLPFLKRRVPLATLARVMWREPKPSARIRPGDAERVPDLVVRLYRGPAGPHEGVCLERSLLTYRFLSGAGADPRLVVGVQGRDDTVIGHAWVVVDGKPVFEPLDAIGEYASFFAFGREGRLERAAT